MVKITIKPRSTRPSKRFPLELEFASTGATVAEVKRAVASKVNVAFHRQRLTTLDKKTLDDDSMTLAECALKDGDVLEFKDLGPQISWRTVFLTEYFGPLLIHPFFYYAQKLVYRREFEHSKMQKFALVLILLHYSKRELETIFVHRFSSATMPAFNIIKNSGHYWGLSGLVLAVPLYGPWNSASSLANSMRDSDMYLYVCTGIWAFAQISNFITHLNLKSLRPAGTRQRGIPRGYGFDLVSCPNYFFEIVAWTAFSFLTLNYASIVFLAAASFTMVDWAKKKHARYRKEFGREYPSGRRVIFPFIL